MLFSTSMLNNVSAELKTYTMDDDGSNITITVGQQFNVSVPIDYSGIWVLVNYDSTPPGGYNSSVLEVVDGESWEVNPWYHLVNITFEGISAGSEQVIFNHHNLDNLIDDSFTLNITVNPSNSISLPLIITVFAIIIVVPSVIIIKWMKGEEKNEN